MKTYLHVDQHAIRRNRKAKKDAEPPISIKTYKGNQKCREVLISGPCRLIYSPELPLNCGATCYLLTESEVIVIR